MMKMLKRREHLFGVGGTGRWDAGTAVNGHYFTVSIKRDGLFRRRLRLEIEGPESKQETVEEFLDHPPPKPYNRYQVLYKDGVSQYINADSFLEDEEGTILFEYRGEIVVQTRWEDVRLIGMLRRYGDD